MMEHRRIPRVSAAVKLLVYRQGVPVALGRIANVSRTGLFVKTEYSDVDFNQKVEVEFQLPSAAATERHRVAATVVHKDTGGLGLEVDDDARYRQVLLLLVARVTGKNGVEREKRVELETEFETVLQYYS